MLAGGAYFSARPRTIVKVVVKSFVGDEPVSANLPRAGDVVVFGGQADSARRDGFAHIASVFFGLLDGHLVAGLTFDWRLAAYFSQGCAVIPMTHLVTASQCDIGEFVGDDVAQVVDNRQGADFIGGNLADGLVVAPCALVGAVAQVESGISHKDGVLGQGFRSSNVACAGDGWQGHRVGKQYVFVVVGVCVGNTDAALVVLDDVAADDDWRQVRPAIFGKFVRIHLFGFLRVYHARPG